LNTMAPWLRRGLVGLLGLSEACFFLTGLFVNHTFEGRTGSLWS